MESPPVILLIETNESEVLLFRLAVGAANSAILIEPVGTLPEALGALRRPAQGASSTIDMIMLAGDTPTMRCRDFVRHLNQDPSSRSIGVSVLTASEDPREREHLEESGIVAYWQKPFDWHGFELVGREIDRYLYARAFSEGRARPRGKPARV
jgi:CheY-like chemotaxis protein